MGKNQAYKAMQRAKMASHTAAGGPDEIDDGMMDGSFHSPEWHAARLASLQTSHTVTWEEWKQKQKEEAKRQGELEDDEARMMREYRAQLDAERARKLARGKNHVDKRDKMITTNRKEKKERGKEREKEKSRNGKKRKRSSKRRKGRSDSDSESESSSSDEDERDYRKERRKTKKDKKDKKHRSRRKRSQSSSDESSSDDEAGPLSLSCYFENGK